VHLSQNWNSSHHPNYLHNAKPSPGKEDETLKRLPKPDRPSTQTPRNVAILLFTDSRLLRNIQNLRVRSLPLFTTNS
ncbi:hypothetical protein LINPERHAP2_LOCUS9494, partial [Linum perenne]